MVIPAKTREVFEQLKACASHMRTVSYGDLAATVGLAAVGVGRQLGFIRDHFCRPRGLLWLNAIAGGGDKWRQSDGFLPEEVALGGDDEVLWRGMVLQVFAYDWTGVQFQQEWCQRGPSAVRM